MSDSKILVRDSLDNTPKKENQWKQTNALNLDIMLKDRLTLRHIMLEMSLLLTIK